MIDHEYIDISNEHVEEDEIIPSRTQEFIENACRLCIVALFLFVLWAIAYLSATGGDCNEVTTLIFRVGVFYAAVIFICSTLWLMLKRYVRSV